MTEMGTRWARRRGHSLVAAHASQSPGRPQAGMARSSLAHRLPLAGLVALAITGCTAAGATPSSATTSGAASWPALSAPVALPTEPAKVPATFDATPAPPITVADCRPGDVAAKVLGYGTAMGTMYIGLRITPTHGSCSVPAAPNATAVDAAGSRAAVGAAVGARTGARVAVTSQGIGFRIAVYSWCDSSKLTALDLVLDPSNGLAVSGALPSDFAVPCTGSATSLQLSQPIEP